MGWTFGHKSSVVKDGNNAYFDNWNFRELALKGGEIIVRCLVIM